MLEPVILYLSIFDSKRSSPTGSDHACRYIIEAKITEFQGAPIFCSLMKLCAQKKDLESGKELHRMIGMINVKEEIPLIHMFCECGDLNGAMNLIRSMDVHDGCAWILYIVDILLIVQQSLRDKHGHRQI